MIDSPPATTWALVTTKPGAVTKPLPEETPPQPRASTCTVPRDPAAVAASTSGELGEADGRGDRAAGDAG